MVDRTWLRPTGWLFAVGFVAHNLDHLRRGTETSSTELLWLGGLGAVAAAVAILLLLTEHEQAPLAAAVVGPPLAIGFSAVHFLPTWSVVSDSFAERGVDALTWAAAGLEVAGALLAGVVGVALLRARHQQGPATS